MITPQEHYPDLGTVVGHKDLYLKREDLHPYGSHKGRSIPVMIDHYYKSGDRRFAISSSGNAALAAMLHAQRYNSENKSPIDLDVFVGTHISPKKLEKLKQLADDDHIRVLTKERPLQALAQATTDGYRSLRQSTDDIALIGYESLAEELTKIPELGAVFMGTSSGTTAEALAQYFLKHKLPIQVHIVQTSSCHPLSAALTSYDGPDEKSRADAIVDQTAFRKPVVIPLITKTGGHGWFATNADIDHAQSIVTKNTSLGISTNSALSVVGAMKAAYQGYEINGAIACMICGD